MPAPKDLRYVWGEAKKRKKARGAFLLLLKRLRETCGKFNQIEDWYKFLDTNLKPVLFVYGDVIPQDFKSKMQTIDKLTSNTRESINSACQTLQNDIEAILKTLPKTNLFRNLVICSFITSALTVGTGVFYLNQNTVTIAIKNQNCASIPPPLAIGMPIKFPGVKLYDYPIVNGGQTNIKLPPASLKFDALEKGKITLSLLGVNSPKFPLDENTSLIFDGERLNNRLTRLDLKPKSKHDLIIKCR